MKPITGSPTISRKDIFEPGGESAKTQAPQETPLDQFTQSPKIRAHVETVSSLTIEGEKMTKRHAAVCAQISLLEKEKAQLEEAIAIIDEQMLAHGKEAATLIDSPKK